MFKAFFYALRISLLKKKNLNLLREFVCKFCFEIGKNKKRATTSGFMHSWVSIRKHIGPLEEKAASVPMCMPCPMQSTHRQVIRSTNISSDLRCAGSFGTIITLNLKRIATCRLTATMVNKKNGEQEFEFEKKNDEKTLKIY